MKNITIHEKEAWKNFILNEASYQIPDECRGGLCVDAGCNIGDFPMNHRNRFSKYLCLDVFQENIDECIKNTKDLNLDIEVHKLAVWSISNHIIDVFAYKLWNSDDLQHFGNSGNIGCVQFTGSLGEGWKPENKIGHVNTISIESIIEKYGTINLLKFDVEGSEYEFLLHKDLSKINYMVGELHYGEDKKNELTDWFARTHDRLGDHTWKLKNF